MQDTEFDLEHTAKRAELDAQPALMLAYHPEPKRVGQFYHLSEEEPLVLGRGHDCFGEGALDDSLISRRHLEITRRGPELEARELGSQNGTLYNGERLEGAVTLSVGDVLALGRVCLVFQPLSVFHRPTMHEQIVGTGPGTARLLEQLGRVAPLDTPVLIQGEAGVGKELVARALHDQSGRSGQFVALNCGAVADGVLHSELFGHLRGAFSGASEARDGLVSDAEDGTLLLDEIGDASASFQVALLRLLEQGEFRAVGSDRVQHAKVRIVAATHVPLQQAVKEGRFRHDLFTRLEQRVIEVGPLRERREDIVAIAQQCLCAAGHAQTTISRSMGRKLLTYEWPGNVRELKAVMSHAISDYDGEGDLMLPAELAKQFAASPSSEAPAESRPSAAARAPHARPSGDDLKARFQELGGNMQALAAELKVGRNTLYRWFRDAGLDPVALRDSAD